MIADRQGYEHPKAQLAEQRERLDLRRDELCRSGFSENEVERAMQPVECFYLGKLEEVHAFEAEIRDR